MGFTFKNNPLSVCCDREPSTVLCSKLFICQGCLSYAFAACVKRHKDQFPSFLQPPKKPGKNLLPLVAPYFKRDAEIIALNILVTFRLKEKTTGCFFDSPIPHFPAFANLHMLSRPTLYFPKTWLDSDRLRLLGSRRIK